MGDEGDEGERVDEEGRTQRSDDPGFLDRRQRPTPMLSRYSFLGGRRGSSRLESRDLNAYVDLYNARLAIMVMVFFTLTVFDALATVYYIDHMNGTEANPLAQWMLDLGSVAFVFAKGVPTAALLLFVMIHNNFRYGRMALALGFSFYFCLTFYHVFLQSWAFMSVLRGKPLP